MNPNDDIRRNLESFLAHEPILKAFLDKKPQIKEFIINNRCFYGELTPIPDRFLKTLPNNQVIINDRVADCLVAIANHTSKTRNEQCFLLFSPSEKVRGNTCNIDTFYSHNENTHSREAVFDDKMIQVISGFADKVKNNKLKPGAAVFVGHTHPAEGAWYDNYSLGDLKGYLSGVIRNNPVYDSRKIESTGCMLTADGKLKMVFFDPERNDLYRFTNIKVKTRDGKLVDFEEYFRLINRQSTNGTSSVLPSSISNLSRGRRGVTSSTGVPLGSTSGRVTQSSVNRQRHYFDAPQLGNSNRNTNR